MIESSPIKMRVESFMGFHFFQVCVSDRLTKRMERQMHHQCDWSLALVRWNIICLFSAFAVGTLPSVIVGKSKSLEQHNFSRLCATAHSATLRTRGVDEFEFRRRAFGFCCFELLCSLDHLRVGGLIRNAGLNLACIRGGLRRQRIRRGPACIVGLPQVHECGHQPDDDRPAGSDNCGCNWIGHSVGLREDA